MHVNTYISVLGIYVYIDELVQGGCGSSALAIELRNFALTRRYACTVRCR